MCYTCMLKNSIITHLILKASQFDQEAKQYDESTDKVTVIGRELFWQRKVAGPLVVNKYYAAMNNSLLVTQSLAILPSFNLLQSGQSLYGTSPNQIDSRTSAGIKCHFRLSFLADRTATQYDRLLAAACCPSVCL